MYCFKLVHCLTCEIILLPFFGKPNTMIDLTHEWQNVLVDQFLENRKFMNSNLSLANAFATKNKLIMAACL